jgi:hypothetical protein
LKALARKLVQKNHDLLGNCFWKLKGRVTESRFQLTNKKLVLEYLMIILKFSSENAFRKLLGFNRYSGMVNHRKNMMLHFACRKREQLFITDAWSKLLTQRANAALLLKVLTKGESKYILSSLSLYMTKFRAQNRIANNRIRRKKLLACFKAIKNNHRESLIQ